MEDLVMKTILYILLLGFIFLIIYIIYRKVKDIISSYVKGYKTVTGKIIKYINVNDSKYIKKEREKLEQDHPKLYNLMDTINKMYPEAKTKDEGPMYFAIYEYEVNDKKYELKATMGSDRKGKIGGKKKIKYNPENPSEAFFKNDFGYLLGILVLLFFILIIYLSLNK